MELFTSTLVLILHKKMGEGVENVGIDQFLKKKTSQTSEGLNLYDLHFVTHHIQGNMSPINILCLMNMNKKHYMNGQK